MKVLEKLLRFDGIAPVNCSGKTLLDVFLWKSEQLVILNGQSVIDKLYGLLEIIARKLMSLNDLAVKWILINKIRIVDNEFPQYFL